MYIMAYIYMLAIHQSTAKNALKYFASKRNVRSSTVLVFDDLMNTTWIVYRYVFNNKRSINVTNWTLKVGVFDNQDAPFDCIISQVNGNLVVEGYSYELLKLVSEALHFRLEFIEMFFDDSHLAMKQIDLIACHPHLDFSYNGVRLHSTLSSKYIIIYKTSKLHFSTDIFILTFVGTLWLCFLVTSVVLAICLRVSTRKYSKIDVNLNTWSWVEITLWAIAAACQQGLSYTPNRFASRCIFFLGYLLAYLLYTGFAAAITSVLVRQERGHIDKMQIRAVMYRCGKLNSIDGIAVSHNVLTMHELFAQLEMKNVVGIGPKLLLEQHVAQQNASHYMFMDLKAPLKYFGSFSVLIGSEWFNVINEKLANIEASGVMKSLLLRHSKQYTTSISETSYSSASLEHVGSASYLYITGLVTSVIFLLFECCVFRYQKFRHKRHLQLHAQI